MADHSGDPDEVVGVRFERHGAVAWYRAGAVPASVRSWVVAERDGLETVAQVVVGRGQCLSFPGDPRDLPGLLREARAEEVPPPPEGGGKRLLESLPPRPAPDSR
jgi:hypothetical protein